MKYFFHSLICVACLLLGCQSASSHLEKWRIQNGKLKVLCTTPIIDDLVGRIGGERIDHLSLMDPSIDPHSYELVKGDDEKFSVAHLVFYNGLGLEHNPSLKTHLLKHPHSIPLGEQVRLKEAHLILQDKGQIDPHIWLDVILWTKTIDPIVDHLTILDPLGEEYYKSQGIIVKKQLFELDQWMQDQLRRIPDGKKYLVTSHDAFNYFARRYLYQQKEQEDWKEKFCAPEGLAPDGQLGFHDLQRVINYIEKHNVRILFPESNVSQDSLKKIAEICSQKGYYIRIASSYLFSDTLSEPESGVRSYEEIMKHNILTLCEAWNTYERS